MKKISWILATPLVVTLLLPVSGCDKGDEFSYCCKLRQFCEVYCGECTPLTEEAVANNDEAECQGILEDLFTFCWMEHDEQAERDCR